MASRTRQIARSNPVMRTAFQSPETTGLDSEPMTIGGVGRSLTMLFAVLLVVAAWSWANVDTFSPGLWFGAIVIAIWLAIAFWLVSLVW